VRAAAHGQRSTRLARLLRDAGPDRGPSSTARWWRGFGRVLKPRDHTSRKEPAMHLPQRFLQLARIATIVLVPVLAGCDSILDTTPNFAQRARIVIEGEDSADLLLVTSTLYVGEQINNTPELLITVLDADSAHVSPPFDRQMELDASGRLLVRLFQQDPSAHPTVRMRIFLDGEEVSDVTAELIDSYMEYVFVYL
jgi:hypothetical protein